MERQFTQEFNVLSSLKKINKENVMGTVIPLPEIGTEYSMVKFPSVMYYGSIYAVMCNKTMIGTIRSNHDLIENHISVVSRNGQVVGKCDGMLQARKLIPSLMS